MLNLIRHAVRPSLVARSPLIAQYSTANSTSWETAINEVLDEEGRRYPAASAPPKRFASSNEGWFLAPQIRSTISSSRF